MSTRVLFDNSAFAGVMRLYCPDVEMHRTFLRNYPDHWPIDVHSLTDFLTALCIYDEILLDSSSFWNEKELAREGYGSRSHIDNSSASWAEQLTRLLPKDVAILIRTGWLGGGSAIDEDESCRKAFDVMNSSLKNEILLSHNEHIPNVYSAKDYVYRETFDRLNEENGYALSMSELAQAMFLHRGLFLQSRAHSQGCVYLPYQYRGKVLAKLPPMVWAQAPTDGFKQARLPLVRGARPDETEYIRSLNEYYYSLLQAVTWTTYDSDVPFVGAAILSAARGNPSDAIDKAMDYRHDGALRRRFANLNYAIHSHDRPRFESLLKQCRSELAAASRHFGLESESPNQRSFYKLATCWMPKNLQELLDTAVHLLPESVRHWGYQASSSLITKTPLQMLFVHHVSAIRGA